MIIKHPLHRPPTEPNLTPNPTGHDHDTARLPITPLASGILTRRGISVVLPAWNEAENIATTVQAITGTLSQIAPNFEVIIVDDGSTDATGALADGLAARDARVRVIHNRPNQGYGGALKTGFAAAQKELTFFMDADGQFDITDIRELIVPLERGAAQVALGYRAQRADPAVRRLNAWAWKRLVSLLFGLRVRDIDCAFKLMPTELVRRAAIEATGAMINTEFLAKFQRMGATLVQVPVHHYPRARGTATGANMRVILRAFRELFTLAGKLRAWEPATTGTVTPPLTIDQATQITHYRAWLDQDSTSDADRPTEDDTADRNGRPTEGDAADRNVRPTEGDAADRNVRPTTISPRAITPVPGCAGSLRDRSHAGLPAGRPDHVIPSLLVDLPAGRPHTPIPSSLADTGGSPWGRVQTFTSLGKHQSAVQTLTRGQAIVLIALVLAWAAGLALWGIATLVVTLALVTIVYVGDLLLTAWLAARTLNHAPEARVDDAVIRALRTAAWPRYTILCPLYRETEVVPQFVQAMTALDYPTDKLQILFLTEADDAATRNAILALGLPDHFEVVTVPDGELRTKPRACNYGLLRATGAYVVIFDAEDIPDPLQLKKAVLTFADHGDDLACVQAKLNFYNPKQNLLTRWFTNEYTLWFDLTLPGLQRLGAALPLGGTSNHFRADVLRQVGGWDPFNVTEDCDLGLRLAQHRLRTVVLDSTTLEEANSRPKNWVRQRSRWIKGYLQTYLVHMRRPWSYVREGRLRDFFALQLVVGARSATLYINPLMWLLVVIYIAFRATVEPTYHVLYPAPIFYLGMVSLVFGNFLYIYAYLIACAKRRQWGMMHWALLIPIYWAMMSVAASVALVQLIFRPYFWEKTQHGLHLKHANTAVSVMDLGLSAGFTIENATLEE